MARIKFLGKVLFFVLLIGGWVAVETASPAAPSWPKKDISFVVPFKPGGGFDIQSRTLAPFLEKFLPNNVNVVIKNVTGAGGKAGIMEIARSKPDGYTIGIMGLEAVSFMQAMGELDVDIREWSWIGQLSSDPLMAAVPTVGKYKTPADMKGQDIRYGVTVEMVPSALILGQALGIKVRLVLFDGSGDAIMALMRGDLDVLDLSWPTMSKGVRDSEGKISALFVTSKSRVSALKDVPTLGELGVQLTSTSASVLAASRVVVGPKGLDKSVRKSLESAVAKAMKDPEFLQRMEKAQQAVGYANSATIKANIASAVEAYTSVKALVEPFLKK
jgi:tripartite-type tricarboxylate transporter receptor subunit TctC